MFQPFKTLRVETKLCCTPLWDQIKMNQDERQLRIQLNQGCQTYGPRAKTGPLRGLISPTGWFCKVKTSSFAWEVYPVILQQMVTRFQLLETLTQLLIFCCFSLFVSCENFPFSAHLLLHVHNGLNFQTGMNMQKLNYCWWSLTLELRETFIKKRHDVAELRKGCSLNVLM